MITGASELLFHIGDPIAQARAPSLVNPRLEALGTNAIIVPFHVAPEGLAAALAGVRAIRNLRGGIVTMPHKVTAAGLVDELTDEARLTGACNVIRRERDGRLVGTMLDGEGLVAALRSSGIPVAGKAVFLAGTGGVALGIAAALARHGASRLRVFNRSKNKADALAARLATTFPRLLVEVLDAPDPAGCAIAVNATSLGMAADDPLPMRIEHLTPDMVAVEVVIRDQPTPFLAAATLRGCRTQPGVAMLEAQISLMIAFMLPETAAAR